jgi:hypothetical protein
MRDVSYSSPTLDPFGVAPTSTCTSLFIVTGEQEKGRIRLSLTSRPPNTFPIGYILLSCSLLVCYWFLTHNGRSHGVCCHHT